MAQKARRGWFRNLVIGIFAACVLMAAGKARALGGAVPDWANNKTTRTDGFVISTPLVSKISFVLIPEHVLIYNISINKDRKISTQHGLFWRDATCFGMYGLFVDSTASNIVNRVIFVLNCKKVKDSNILHLNLPNADIASHIQGGSRSGVFENYKEPIFPRKSAFLSTEIINSHISTKFYLGVFSGNSIRIDGRVGRSDAQTNSENQGDQPNSTYGHLPIRQIDHRPGVIGHLSSRGGHGLLRYQVILFALLGGLTAGAAGWVGGGRVAFGSGWRRKSVGCAVLVCGFAVTFTLWCWGVYGHPLAVFDRLGPFWGALTS